MNHLARIFILAALLLPLTASAGIQQIRVLGVGVDRSSQKAEALALDYAKKRAVYLVARKLQVENASDRLAALKPTTMEAIIRGATILNQRRDKEITYLDVSVSVVDTELKRALDITDTSQLVAENPNVTRNILVLPYYKDETRAYLWEDTNPLREALRSEVLRQSQGAVMMPGGDFEDLRLIDHLNAPTITGSQLLPMFDRYGADEIIIAMVVPGAEQTAAPTAITLRRLTREGVRTEMLRVTPADANERGEVRVATAAHAAATAVMQIATATAGDEQAVLAGATKVQVTFEYANPRELASMQQALRNTPGVLALMLPEISLQTIQATAYLKQEKQTVRAALIKQGIRVAEKQGSWVLSMR